ncbi:sensor histidine kinase [Ohtaekwangia koreensis]|uniref:sensor histidine kinase n=1 Tax=Ohtaekwangia koreensis TaxID=688867 RepID=UPI00135671B7|nr:HAMP domain-containing sensor histidine kinase [Ohtaekwangia koreensis]
MQNYPIEVYQGASQNWAVRQDKQGTIYIANTEGVLKYDGNRWDLLSLPDKEAIYAVDIDSAGKVYIASDYDLGYFQRKANERYEYHSLLSKLPDSCKQNMAITWIRVIDNKVFFRGENHVYVYNDGHFKILHTLSQGMIQNPNNLYIQKDNGLHRYKNDGFETAPYFRKIKGMVYKWVTDYGPDSFLVLDDKNQVWLVDEKHPEQWKVFSEQLNQNLKNLKIQSMACLDNGNIAIHIGKGILFFSTEGKLHYSIYKDDLMLWGYLFEDKQHNLWVNGDSKILQVISSSQLSYYDSENGLEGFVLSLGRKGSDQYIGTDKGILYQENRNTFTLLQGTEGGAWNFYNFQDKLYVMNESGVFELQGKKVTKILGHEWVMSMCELRKHSDRIILGTYYNGIWLLQQKGNEWSKKKIKGFEEETRYIQEDEEGNIWISHYNKGIWKLQLNEQMDSVVSRTFYGKPNGLPSNLNNRIYRLNGEVVAATVDGIYRYNKNSDRFESQEKYNKALGKGFCIYSFTESPEGDIYFWGAHAHKNETAGVLKKQSDGNFKLLLTPFNKIATPFRDLRLDVDAPILVGNSGEVWIGNNWKVYSYNPNQKYFYNDPIQLSIQKVWTRDSLIYQHPEKESTHTLPFAFNNFKFEFLCSFFEDTDKNLYQYKMDGFENKWSDWTLIKEAFFTNLPEGNYTFYVRAKNIYGVVSEPASFTFRIAPPWYRTALGYLLYIVSFFALLYSVIQLNIRRIKKQKIALEEVVTEKTKELINVNEELSQQNYQLYDAKITIENRNREIKHRNETLEEEVSRRTKELVEYNHQLEQFAFVTAHNLRGPVARILGLGNILNLTENVPHEVKTITDKLVFTAEEIDSVVSDLNQILQIKNTPSQLEELDLEKITSKVISDLEKEIKNANAIISTDFSEIQSIITSKVYLESVLFNLLGNSIKFRHPDRVPDIKITAVNANDYISLIISDNGLGIDLQKNKDKLFTLYARFHLHIDGKGRGLHLAQTQMSALGGKIKVQSEVDIGTTFEVLFKKPDLSIF